jgi:hypothetical protein
MAHTKRNPADGRGRVSGKSQAQKLTPRDTANRSEKQASWRDTYKVHPAADAFPMLSDDELAKLGEDIKANGLKQPIVLFGKPKDEPTVLDGGNRLEAMARIGMEPSAYQLRYIKDDPVAYVISANIHRRHLTKQQQSDLIVAAHRAAAKAEHKPRQLGEVSKGGRGKINKVKAAAVATAKDHGIGKRTIERSFAKAEGHIPQPKPIVGPKLKSKPRLEKHVGIDAARRYYLDRCAEPGVDLDAEQDIVIDALREIAGKRAMQAQNATGALPAQVDLEDCIREVEAVANRALSGRSRR